MDMIEKAYMLFVNAIGQISLDTYAAIATIIATIIAVLTFLSSRQSKIRVNICYNNNKEYYEIGYSLRPSCDIVIKNLSSSTKYIQSVYMKYKYTPRSKKEGKFLVSNEPLAIEPQAMTKISVTPDSSTFLKGQNRLTRVYAVAVDALGKEWVSLDSITVEMLQRITVYMG